MRWWTVVSLLLASHVLHDCNAQRACRCEKDQTNADQPPNTYLSTRRSNEYKYCTQLSRYFCMLGYGITQNFVSSTRYSMRVKMTCPSMTTTWQPKKHCRAIPNFCDAHLGIPNSNFNGTSESQLGTNYSISCNVGFTVNGVNGNTVQCVGSDGNRRKGAWSVVECRPTEHYCLNPIFRNGDIDDRYGNWMIGSIATYSCNKGYVKTYPSPLKCVAGNTNRTSGQWSGIPVCSVTTCPLPEGLLNGAVSVSSLRYDSQASYTCNQGYRLVGSTTRTCHMDGEWRPAAPQCQVDACADPGVPDHGSRTDAYQVGSSVRYHCDAGHVLSGAATSTCSSGATWDNKRPSCVAAQVGGSASQDCKVAAWAGWSACSVTCLDGTQTRTRTVIQQHTGSGQACPALTETRACRVKDVCGCGDIPLGSSQALLRQSGDSAADIILVVDESSSMGFYQGWISETIVELERRLVSVDGIGASPTLRNHYALVGFGRDQTSADISLGLPHALTGSSGEKVFTIESFLEAASGLVENGNIEDGYLAIQYALENLTDSQGNNLLRLGQHNVAIKIILLTDEDRDVLLSSRQHITRSSISTLLRNRHASVNAIVDQTFTDGNRRAFGMDVNAAFLVEPDGKYSNSSTPRVSTGYGSTRQDYTTVALATGGSAWDITSTQQGGPAMRSITDAFISATGQELRRRVDQCQYCSCEDLGTTTLLTCNPGLDQDRCKLEAAAGRR